MADIIDLKRERKEASDQIGNLRAEYINVIGKKGDDGNYNLTAENETKRIELTNQISIQEGLINSANSQINSIESIRENAERPVTNAQGNIIVDSNGKELKKFTNTDQYREDFLKMGKGNKESAERILDLHKEYRNLGDADTSELLVPTCTEERIITECEKASALFSLSNVISTSWAARDFVIAVDDYGPMAPTKNCAEICKCEPGFNQKNFSINKYACALPICNELIDDNLGLDNFLSYWWSQKMTATIEEYGFKGAKGKVDYITINDQPKKVDLTGCVPKGIDNEDPEYVIPCETAKTGLPTWEDIITAMCKVCTQSMNNGTWLFPKDAMCTLALLKDNTGRPLWLPSLSGDKPSTFCGRPVVFSDYLPDYSGTITAGQCLGYFGDWSKHNIWMRRGLTIDSSSHYLFLNDMTTLRAKTRWTSGIITKNHFVKLVSA